MAKKKSPKIFSDEIVPLEKIKEKLNMKQEYFCQCYTRNNRLFGNATMAYAESHGYQLDLLNHEPVTQEIFDKKRNTWSTVIIDKSEYDKAYNVCSVSGERLLRNVKINNRIKELLVNLMDENEFDSELVYTMRQREDLGAKMAAIKEFNRLKSRVTEKIIIDEVTVDDKTKQKSSELLKSYLNGGKIRKIITKR